MGLNRKFFVNGLPSQVRFHRLRTKFRGFSGAVGSGKSRALCEALLIAGYLNVGSTGLLGCPTYAMLRDATLRTLFEVMDSLEIPFKLAKSSMVLTLTEVGTQILCRSVENFDRLRGTNLAFFGLDETSYCPEGAWMQLEARLRDPRAVALCGFGCWTPKGHDWVYRRFIKERLPNYAAVLANPMENTYLPADFYQGLLNSYSPEFARQEVLGEYLNVFAGRAYASFESGFGGNVWRTAGPHRDGLVPCHYRAERPLLWALDFNVSPATSVICQSVPQRPSLQLGSSISGRGREKGSVQLNVLDEIYLANASTYEHVEEFWKRIQPKLPGYPHRLKVVLYGDASGARRQSSASESDYAIIRNFFKRHANDLVLEERVPTSNPAVRDRVNAVNAMCLTYTGNRRLCVHERCRELIHDLEEVTFAADTHLNIRAEIKNTDPKRTHVSDALGYLIHEEWPLLGGVGERPGITA